MSGLKFTLINVTFLINEGSESQKRHNKVVIVPDDRGM